MGMDGAAIREVRGLDGSTCIASRLLRGWECVSRGLGTLVLFLLSGECEVYFIERGSVEYNSFLAAISFLVMDRH